MKACNHLSMQLKTIAMIHDLLENIDDNFRHYILENGVNQKTNISFTNSKRMYDDGIERYLKKEHFYRVLTNRDTIKRNCMLYLAHFTSGFNDWKHICYVVSVLGLNRGFLFQPISTFLLRDVDIMFSQFSKFNLSFIYLTTSAVSLITLEQIP